jgi:hypothetical protein
MTSYFCNLADVVHSQAYVFPQALNNTVSYKLTDGAQDFPTFIVTLYFIGEHTISSLGATSSVPIFFTV